MIHLHFNHISLWITTVVTSGEMWNSGNFVEHNVKQNNNAGTQREINLPPSPLPRCMLGCFPTCLDIFVIFFIKKQKQNRPKRTFVVTLDLKKNRHRKLHKSQHRSKSQNINRRSIIKLYDYLQLTFEILL